LAYAYNRPVAYLETNIRAVLLHHCFVGRAKVDDRRLLPLAERVLDRDHPRCWHSALMDYGTWLKQQQPRAARAGARRQGRFEGSNRQLRGMIVRSLTRRSMSLAQLAREIKRPRSIIGSNLRSLRQEGLVALRSGYYRIS
ncbi:MAG TPA: ArsR family transcriptional regulator, partial [Candidatus Edwardsbacteria bacterium]|nr:ArsR family transcriptional regulator [Candidatus Edwardsbacteria bacterium]